VGETNEMIHLKHCFVWCSELDTFASRSEIPESFEMWWWRRMEKINWVVRVKMKKYYTESRRNEIL